MVVAHDQIYFEREGVIARYLTVTDAIRDLIGRDEHSVTVTAVPVVRPSALATADQAADVLTVDQVALHTFE